MLYTVRHTGKWLLLNHVKMSQIDLKAFTSNPTVVMYVADWGMVEEWLRKSEEGWEYYLASLIISSSLNLWKNIHYSLYILEHYDKFFITYPLKKKSTRWPHPGPLHFMEREEVGEASHMYCSNAILLISAWGSKAFVESESFHSGNHRGKLRGWEVSWTHHETLFVFTT